MSHLLYLHSGNFNSLVASFSPEFVRRGLSGRPNALFAEELSEAARHAQLDYAKIASAHHEALSLVIHNFDRAQAGRPVSPCGISDVLLNAFEPRFIAEDANNARFAMLYGKRPGMPSLRARDDFEFFLLPPSDVARLAEIVTRVASRGEKLTCRDREQASLVEEFASEVVQPVESAAKKTGSFLFGRWA